MTPKQAYKRFAKNIIDIDLFRSRIYVFFDKDEYNAMLDYRGHKEYDCNSCDGVTFECRLPEDNSDIVNMMGIFEDSIIVIAHEATHMGNAILDQIGHETSKYDEILPYLVGYITDKIIEMKKKNDQ